MLGSPRSFLLPAIFLSVAVTAWGQSFDRPAAGLARKIAAAMKPGERVTVSFRNLSSMDSADASAGRVALERELLAQRVVLRANGAVEVAVTISEDSRGYLWVAEIRRGDTREVMMEQADLPRVPVAAAGMTIEKKLLFEQEEPILDFSPASAAAGAPLVVLDGEGISLQEGNQTPRLPIALSGPRDLRGRVVVQNGAYRAYLPGVECNGVIVNGLSVTCNEQPLWPIGSGVQASFARTRNFFDGHLVMANTSEKNLPAFLSAAWVQDRGRGEWLMAGVDGRTYLYNATFGAVGSWTGWGSDVAGIESECGARSQVLATKMGDSTVADGVQAYEILDGTPQLVGDSAAFPGPVTALWPGPEHDVAFAVSRDLKSGRYAAFRLAITCGR